MFFVLFFWRGFRSPARPSQGELTPEEVGVLKDSSYVNGKLFMPWIADDLQVTCGRGNHLSMRCRDCRPYRLYFPSLPFAVAAFAIICGMAVRHCRHNGPCKLPPLAPIIPCITLYSRWRQSSSSCCSPPINSRCGAFSVTSICTNAALSRDGSHGGWF